MSLPRARGAGVGAALLAAAASTFLLLAPPAVSAQGLVRTPAVRGTGGAGGAVANTSVTEVGTRRYEVALPGRARGVEFRVPLVGRQEPRVRIGPVVDGFTRVELLWPDTTGTDDAPRIDFDLAPLAPDFHWIPHLTPLPGTVVGEHVFRSPAVITANGPLTFALIPDLDVVAQPHETPWYLDLEAPAQRAALGVSKQDVPIHVLFRQLDVLSNDGPLEVAFWVGAWVDANPRATNPFGPVSRFLWSRYARGELDKTEVRSTPLEDYAQAAYTWAFETWKDAVYMEFDLGGLECAGVQLITDHTQAPSFRGQRSILPVREIWNQAWFSNLRSATGVRRWGERLRRPDWIDRADRMKNLVLAAPRTNGLFPTVLQLQEDPVTGDWLPTGWTGSDRVPTERGIQRDWLHVLDMSWTALHALRWHEDVEADARLLAMVRTYVERLVTLQSQDGHFPAWLHPLSQAPDPTLADSPETALSATLLFEYVRQGSGTPAQLQAAFDAVDAALVPALDGRWEDFETYWSDSVLGRTTNVGRRFVRNAMYKQCNFSMYWVAEALLRAYEASADPKYLRLGRRVLDELSMTQQVWQPSDKYVRTVGGFGVMNLDGEWNDARQALFAELYMQYYAATGDVELFERGLAALRASFVMMHHPSLPDTLVQWRRAYPSLTDEDFGYMAENYGHFGFTRPDGTGMTAFTIFDWGSGGAAEAGARILDHWGDVYLDKSRGRAFGINAVDVVPSPSRRGRWLVRDLAQRPRWIEVVTDTGSRNRVYLNGSVEI